MSESTTPIEGTVVERAKPLETDEYRPMSKVEAGVILGVLGAVVTAVGFGIRADIKQQAEYARQMKLEREERDQRAAETRKARTMWFDDQRKSGKTVLELRDGSYIAIDNEAYAKAEIKKKGQWL